MYSKFGNMEAARYLFDKMPERNKVSWNTVMSAYVRVGSYKDTFDLFVEMRVQEIEPSGAAIASLMTACSRSTDMLYEGFQIHGFVIKLCLLWDVYVGTSLLHFYGVYGFASSAKRLFEDMPIKNIVSWTALLVTYLDNGDPGEALNIYRRMRHEGVACNQTSFTSIISLCGLLEDELMGQEVHALVIKSGYENNVSVANSLISMFGSFSNMKNACYVFNHMIEQDTISWNSMISAYALNGLCEESYRYFHSMRLVHNEINAITLSALLSVCGSMDNLKWGQGIHGLVVKLGLDSNICICNTLLTMYSNAGRPKEAEELFQEMPERDLISWNSIMAGYVLDGKFLNALKVLVQMLKVGKTMNFVTFASAAAACSNPEFIAEGKVIHALVIIFGLQDNLVVGNALVTMYGKCGIMTEARKVFEKMPEKDLVTWNSLIGSYAENEEPDEAVRVFELLRGSDIPSNYISIINVLGAFSNARALMIHGRSMHAHIFLTGFESDDYVRNSLMTMYAKCGDLKSSKCIFSRLLSKDPVTWNIMIAANTHHGDGEEAIKLFMEMQRAGADLDQFSFSSSLAATANLAILDEGKQLHCQAIKLGFDSYLYVTNGIMDMYGKCAEMDDVLKMLPEPNMRSRLSWNILISTFARYGLFDKAREAFHEMVKLGIKPDHVTFVSLLSACSHGGLVEEGLAYLSLMTRQFGVPAHIEHYVCIIDLLGRSGRLFEAENFIKEMPVPPNEFVWRSLLAACRIHGNVELGRKAAENILQFNPSDDSAYVLFSNVCANSGKWDHVEYVREHMQSYRVKKQPAFKQNYAKLGELRKIVLEQVIFQTQRLHCMTLTKTEETRSLKP
ncbi:hypothetical protein NMG60_11027960 [Bertholletia excelsa]